MTASLRQETSISLGLAHTKRIKGIIHSARHACGHELVLGFLPRVRHVAACQRFRPQEPSLMRESYSGSISTKRGAPKSGGGQRAVLGIAMRYIVRGFVYTFIKVAFGLAGATL